MNGSVDGFVGKGEQVDVGLRGAWDHGRLRIMGPWGRWIGGQVAKWTSWHGGHGGHGGQGGQGGQESKDKRGQYT